MRHENRDVPSNAVPSTAAAHTYRLKFMEGGRALHKEVEFDAQDAALAFAIAEKEPSSRSAELWCDGNKLCTMRREHGVWEIS